MADIMISDVVHPTDGSEPIVVLQLTNTNDSWLLEFSANVPVHNIDTASRFFNALKTHCNVEIFDTTVFHITVHMIGGLGLAWVGANDYQCVQQFVEPGSEKSDDIIRFIKLHGLRDVWVEPVTCVIRSRCGSVLTVGKFFFSTDKLIELLNHPTVTSTPKPVRVRPKRIVTETSIQKLINTFLSNGNSAGNISDGYHTFNELYDHRAKLFAALCNSVFKDIAWKSKQHHDPDFPMFDGMFIVGIDTPIGQATYHYDIDPYWDLFHVKELERATPFDGHTPEEAVNRILDYATMPQVYDAPEACDSSNAFPVHPVETEDGTTKDVPLSVILCLLTTEDRLSEFLSDHDAVIIYYRYDENSEEDKNLPNMKVPIVYRGIRYVHHTTASAKRYNGESFDDIKFRFTLWVADTSYQKDPKYKADYYMYFNARNATPKYIRMPDEKDVTDETHGQ